MKSVIWTVVTAPLWFTAVTGFPNPWSHGKQSNEDHGHGHSNGHHHNQFHCSVPKYEKKLPVYRLHKSVEFPCEELDHIFKTAAPGHHVHKKEWHGSRYYYAGNRLVGHFDKVTGETSVFPKLEELKPANTIQAGDVSKYLRSSRIFPKDDTETSIMIGSRLAASKNKKNVRITPPAFYLADTEVQRLIRHGNRKTPVCGPGSKASFSFSADHKIKGISHRWRSAKKSSSTVQPISQSKVQQSVFDQLSAANITNATVQAVELCFFDSGNKYIQPVYRYNATVSHPFGLADELVVGYVPAGGQALEPLPSLLPPKAQPLPTPAATNTTQEEEPPVVTRRQSQQDKITVGRYAMSNDQYSPQIVVDANHLWGGISASQLPFAGLFGHPNRFLDSQYYWSEPFEFESDEQFFVDKVNLAFTEGHGAVHLFTTNETLPGWGTVNIADIPSVGLGPNSGGQLAYWIIRACQTISTPADYSAADFHLAFDVWWSVFNGLHAVLGYRSNAQVYDDSMGSVGLLIGLGGGVVHSWLNTAKKGGKTAAVAVCGHADDTVFQKQGLGRPSCLQEWWWDLNV
ncbi:MAG: hypothetical protein Q9167_003176 [Letrouitia subvulpina]